MRSLVVDSVTFNMHFGLTPKTDAGINAFLQTELQAVNVAYLQEVPNNARILKVLKSEAFLLGFAMVKVQAYRGARERCVLLYRMSRYDKMEKVPLQFQTVAHPASPHSAASVLVWDKVQYQLVWLVCYHLPGAISKNCPVDMDSFSRAAEAAASQIKYVFPDGTPARVFWAINGDANTHYHIENTRLRKHAKLLINDQPRLHVKTGSKNGDQIKPHETHAFLLETQRSGTFKVTAEWGRILPRGQTYLGSDHAPYSARLEYTW